MISTKRLIDANILKTLFDVRYDTAFIQERTRENKEQWNGYCTGINWGRNTIADAPTVDAVEVVRCRDCKHHSEIYGNRCKKWSSTLSGLTHFTGPDDFCSYGERRSCDD